MISFFIFLKPSSWLLVASCLLLVTIGCNHRFKFLILKKTSIKINRQSKSGTEFDRTNNSQLSTNNTN